jgi:DNA-binding NtrC family response regulator
MGSLQRPQEALLEKAIEAFEQSFILKALERQGWSQIATAKALGIPVSTLKYKLKKLNLSKHFPPKRK